MLQKFSKVLSYTWRQVKLEKRSSWFIIIFQYKNKIKYKNMETSQTRKMGKDQESQNSG